MGETFTYQGRDRAGTLRSGTLDADSEAAVVGRLRQEGIIPLSIDRKASAGVKREIKRPTWLGGGKV